LTPMTLEHKFQLRRVLEELSLVGQTL